MRPLSQEQVGDGDRGPHTLKVWKGSVVGVFGRDVFVELGPRMQGVIESSHFERPPALGSVHEFTLRGQEAGLWSLALSSEASLPTWEQMELGSLVQARAVRVAPGGLEVKVGALHGFLPKSHTGLPRDQRVDPLVGRVLTVEVIEIDRERQRVTVSRKLVLQRERQSEHQREIDRVRVGQVVHGRVTRIEDYGAFVAFGHGLEGLVHVSNLSHERVEHPSRVVALDQSLELKVLHVRRGGARIGLGLKQMQESPWRCLERTIHAGQILAGVVARVLPFGAFVAVRAGVEGLVPLSHAGLGAGAKLASIVRPGHRLSVRVLEFDCQRERLALSLLHVDGRRILADEAENAATFEGLARSLGLERLGERLAGPLARALERDAG